MNISTNAKAGIALTVGALTGVAIGVIVKVVSVKSNKKKEAKIEEIKENKAVTVDFEEAKKAKEETKEEVKEDNKTN